MLNERGALHGGTGPGTETEKAVRTHYDRRNRVVILTDEQAHWHGSTDAAAVPSQVPVYTWNLAGYRVGQAQTVGNAIRLAVCPTPRSR
jgi:hypothetical protein